MIEWLKRHRIWMWGLLVLGVVALRLLYWSWQNVPALNQDEAAILLNARFLWESGKDEWGQSWPLVFRSFGDYKLPGYIYGTALIGGLTGFPWWSVRVLSWGAGLLNLVLVFLLAQKLFSSRQAGWLAFWLLFASPWSWHYGSIGFEANVGLSFFLIALLLVLKSKITWWSIAVTAGVIILGGLTYNTPFLLSPLLLWALWWSHKPRRKQHFALAAAVIAAVAAVALLTWPATQQKQGISVFSDATLLAQYPVYRAQFGSFLTQKFLGNQYVYFGRHIMQNTLSSFDWIFLVIRGGKNPWHTIPDTGHLLFLVPLLAAIGIGWLARSLLKNKTRSQALLILGLLLGALAPAVITVDAPHATRSLFFFVMLTVVAAGTWTAIMRQVTSKFLRMTFQQALIVLLVVGWLWWWLPVHKAWHQILDANRRWYVGLETALQQVPLNDQPIFILDPDGVLYTRVALDQNLSQSTFTKQAVRSHPDAAGIIRVTQLGRYHFVSAPPVETSGYYLQPANGQGWAMIEL